MRAKIKPGLLVLILCLIIAMCFSATGCFMDWDEDDYADYEDEDEDYEDEYEDYEDEGEGLELEEEIVLITYSIENGKLELFEEQELNDDNLIALQEDTDKHYELWSVIAEIVPDEPMIWISYFEIATDGVDGTMGYIENMDDELEEWILTIDIVDVYDAEGELCPDILVETLIHELGHIITLNPTQIIVEDSGEEDPGIPTYHTDFGYLRENSYLNQFVQRFWLELLDEWQEIHELKESDPEYYEEAIYEFYEKYEDQFVSDYAATEPDEDIAETFMYFVMEDKPAGRTVAEKKILFLYEYPELVELRRQLRQNVAYLEQEAA